MLKKLELRNIGRFSVTKTDGNEQYFSKNTFIFGRNTYGKSTLTATFRSLKSGNIDFIVGRKTIGSEKQLVRVTLEDNKELWYTSDKGSWSGIYPQVMIFDNHFVRENVYTQTQQIEQEQQKSIETFMLGATGAEYLTKINQLTKDIGDNKNTQTSIKTEYSRNRHFLGNLEFDEFVLIEDDEHVEERLKENNNKLEQIKNAELISRKLQTLKGLVKKCSEFDINLIATTLSIDTDVINAHFEQHIKTQEGKQIYSDFLQKGSRLRTRDENEVCPFCTQSLDTPEVKSFLQVIDTAYNESYRNLIRNIKDAEAVFSSNPVSESIDSVKTDLKTVGYELSISFEDFLSVLTVCESIVASKKEDLSVAIDVQEFNKLVTLGQEITTAIENEIKKFENPDDAKENLEKEGKRLIAIKERYSHWKDRIDSYLKAQEDNNNLGREKGALWDKYKKYAVEMSSLMRDDINAFLDGCFCDFKMQRFEFQGNQRQELFALVLQDHEIANQGSESELTIKKLS